jgi:hypothetical protein
MEGGRTADLISGMMRQRPYRFQLTEHNDRWRRNIQADTFVSDCWRPGLRNHVFFSRNISPFVSFLNKEKFLLLGPSLDMFLFFWDPKRTKDA